MKQQLQDLLRELNKGLVDRDEALKLSLLAVLAGENVLLIGPPGTGKSLIARRIAECFAQSPECSGEDYFEYLLTKFSTPEEIFGPLSISELKADRFKRNTGGYLPAVKIAFLDEIFKASSSILNALLTILNEKIYHNGAERQKVPLQALLAASNELPTGQEELNALYDRFLVRSHVGYVGEERLGDLLFPQADGEPAHIGRLKDRVLEDIKKASAAVSIPLPVQEAIQEILRAHREAFKEDRREQLSDRRLKKLIHLLQVAALTNDRQEVNLSDLLLLNHCLWSHPDNQAKVAEIVRDTVSRYRHTITDQSDGDSTPAPAPEPVARPKQRKNVIKGYTGSGTADDPLLISNVDELLGLARPEIGLQGYHFRQTADVNCGGLTSWEPIQFKGHYDGGGYWIIGAQPVPKKMGGFGSVFIGNSNPEFHALFGSLHSESTVMALQLFNFHLANRASQSRISYCSTNRCLVGVNVSNSEIEGCVSKESLIGGEAINSKIMRCESGSTLIGFDSSGYADKCEILDCLVLLDYKGKPNTRNAGIADSIKNDSKVDRCLVAGSIGCYSGEYHYIFSGVACDCNSSQILNSALGPLEKSSRRLAVDNRIANNKSGTLYNNAAIDTVECDNKASNPNGDNGKTVPAASFNQYFFEHTLGWDFDKVWQWDSQTNLPSLQNIGAQAQSISAPISEPTNNVDLLTRQLKNNLWL